SPTLVRLQSAVVFKQRAVVITLPNGEVREVTVLVAGFAQRESMPIPVGAQIGSSDAPFVLNGDLVDAVLAANWSPGMNDSFEAPDSPRDVGQTSPTGDDGNGTGAIYFAFGGGFGAVASGFANDATGVYASTVVVTRSGVMV